MNEETGFSRWAQLMDRQAREEALTPEEAAFCERFARGNGHGRRGHTDDACERELAAYAALSDLDAPPDDESRALVDRTLRQLEAEDAERAVHDVHDVHDARELRGSRLRSSGWLIASAVGAAAMLLAVIWRANVGDTASAKAAAPRALTRAELVYSAGEVRVGSERAGAGRTLLAEGVTIETKAGTACVLVDSDINLCLDTYTSVRLAALHTAARRVELQEGTVATRLSAQPEGMSLTIAAGDVSSMAVGTAFSVERRANAPVVTTVLNGKVRVARGDVAQLVNAHERAISDANQMYLKPVSRNEEAASWALLGPTMLWHDPVSATLEVLTIQDDSASAEAWLDGQLIGRVPLWSLVPIGAHRLIVRDDSKVLFDQELHWNAGQSHRVRFDEAREAVPVPVAEPRAPTKRRRAKKARPVPVAAAKVAAESTAATDAAAQPSAADLLKNARRLMREGRMRAAADAYEMLRRLHPESDEAHTVLVSLGQIQLSALHEPQRALALLDEYLERGGTLAEEARLNRIRALRDLDRPGDEARAIREFLGKHPRNFEATALRERLVTLESKPTRSASR